MSDVTISDFSEPELEAFMQREWPAYDEPLGIRWETRNIVLAAKLDDVPVGIARGLVIGGVAELKQLLVKQGHDRKGVGSRLIGEFEARCRAAGAHKIRLETADYQARPFYERHGYRCAATLDDDRFGHAMFIMEKRL